MTIRKPWGSRPEKTREIQRERSRRWRKRNPGEAAKVSAEYRIRHRGEKYGLTTREYDVLFEEQGGGCAICGTANELLCVDHNHSTGSIRGLLCKQCNLGIANLRDNPALLRLAIKYLERG